MTAIIVRKPIVAFIMAHQLLLSIHPNLYYVVEIAQVLPVPLRQMLQVQTLLFQMIFVEQFQMEGQIQTLQQDHGQLLLLLLRGIVDLTLQQEMS